ncbi:MAG: hypothetical protein AVDCRST_MAG03-2310 [uncultured Rubrobacteraceae bacterium]|uniref:Alkaline phosphatase n=1 Tax=uncultured Rubrobacteraceae bacterium TaxID=349277 RepID=A0A6J4PL57_9ACTN|nr:MAG: hypothetical protein AVDCRST_MAG03-2310 [uncultured Rubrobacteraceae bacterium]
MRKIATMTAALMFMLTLSTGAAFAALVEGNNNDNTLFGTPRADTIEAYGGEDLVIGLKGKDRIYGGKGQDRLFGGYGDDHIVSRDLNPRGIGQRDVVNCGPGHDTFVADLEDRVRDNCEEGSVIGS